MMQLMLFLVPLYLAQDLPFDTLLRRLEQMPPRARAEEVGKFLAGRSLPLVEADTILTFLWYGVADSVLVNGALQEGWSRPARMERLPCGADAGAPSLFYKRYAVPRDARLEYQLIVNGVAELDPRNARITPGGDYSNSEAAMPGFVPTRWTHRRVGVPQGRLDTLVFTPRDTTLKPRRVVVYLPDDSLLPIEKVNEPSVVRTRTAETPDGLRKAGRSGTTPPRAGEPRDASRKADAPEKLPSIYVHDGESALQYLSLTTVLENMIAEGEMSPVVCVFIPPVERGQEYAGRKLTRFVNALADELVPLIERRYPVARNPAGRGTMGISNGGHVAIAAGLSRPDVFGFCAGQSSPVTPVLAALADVRARSAPLPREFRLYQQCGLYDIVSEVHHILRENREFSVQLAALSIRHRYVETSDGHDWPSWRERVPDILRFFFRH